MVFDLTLTDPLARVQAFWSAISTTSPTLEPTWDHPLTPYITPLSSTLHPPSNPHPSGALSTTRFLLRIAPPLCNRARNLHGGCAATVFDLLTSVALAPVAREGRFAYAGVSRTLGCNYLRPVPEGMVVCVTCEVVGVGGRMAFLRGTMREWVVGGGEGGEGGYERGEVLCSCEHGKVNTDVKL